MKKSISKRENFKLFLGTINAIIYMGIFLCALIFGYPIFYFKGYIVFFGLHIVMYVLFGKIFDSFELGETTTTDLFMSYVLMLLMCNFFSYIVICLVKLSFLPITPVVLVQIIEVFVSAILLKIENTYIRKNFPPVKVIVVQGEEHYGLVGKLNNIRDLSMSVIKTINLEQLNYDDLDNEFLGADGIVTLDVHHDNKKRIFKACYERGLLIYDIPSITDMLLASSDILHMVDTPILKINKFGPNQTEAFLKRIVDIVGSLVLLIIASPIMLLTIIAIKLEDGGDIFYKQTRLTEGKKEFGIIKFRSMIMNAESTTGAVLAKQHDNRITKVGSFIRKTRIDELPQLINILKGDMSFVGPRPERPEIANEICKDMPEFEYRLVVKAGLTGYAQVYGKYNTQLRDKLLLDLYYIENYSLINDIKLLLMTIKIVFKKDSTEGVE